MPALGARQPMPSRDEGGTVDAGKGCDEGGDIDSDKGCDEGGWYAQPRELAEQNIGTRMVVTQTQEECSGAGVCCFPAPVSLQCLSCRRLRIPRNFQCHCNVSGVLPSMHFPPLGMDVLDKVTSRYIADGFAWLP
eukprot:CAMPEP_0119144262 /NCGR_PEP_ID=MMETSP1310-20130426/35613_1 /TAXON_ID=464262 /ORGANISM="Genus nov. species nov., Strain RCC2339" /LENGTH=134 /DNA_ID=CAMNT_0007135989 /DNA_START=422 /DNA_END=822 /DNA_ORIENTATION=+